MSDRERWKPIPGYDRAYWVSNHGRVRSHLAPSGKPGIPWYIMDRPQKILSTNSRRGRYPCVNLSIDGRKTQRVVHRLVMEAFVGPCPDGMIVCHADDDPTNNHLDNLRYATYAQNTADAIDNGAIMGGAGTRRCPDPVVNRNAGLRRSQWALIDRWAEDGRVSMPQILRQIVREYTMERIGEDDRQDVTY